MSVVAVVRHNISTAGLWRLRLSNDTGFSRPVFDNAVTVPPAGIDGLRMDFLAQSYASWDPDWQLARPTLYPPASLEWEDDNFWTGSITEVAARVSVHAAGGAAQTDGGPLRPHGGGRSTNPDGYIELGRVFVGRARSPRYNASWGASIGWETDTTVSRSLSSTPYFDRKPGRRVQRFDTGYLSKDEAFANVFEVQRRAGVDREVLLVFDKDDPINMLRQSYLGRFRALNPVARAFVGNHSTSFEIEMT